VSVFNAKIISSASAGKHKFLSGICKKDFTLRMKSFFVRFTIWNMGANGKTNKRRGRVTVARLRNPNRDKAKQTWLESGGNTPTKDLAAMAGVSETQIRKWKSADKWKQALDALNAPKRGGQPGNQNAAGHGAPTGNKNAEGYGAPAGNTNAETHGAYSRIHLESLTPEEREYLNQLTLNAETTMLMELQLLFAKERDLAKRINKYQNDNSAELFIDKVIEMLAPKDRGNKKNSKTKITDDLKMTMQTVIKTSPFNRIMKLEAEYNKIHGRILKLIDTIRAHEIDTQRLALDKRRHALRKQQLIGEYSVDPATGELDDSEDAEDMDAPPCAPLAT
jgi:uncharacterized protein YjcR